MTYLEQLKKEIIQNLGNSMEPNILNLLEQYLRLSLNVSGGGLFPNGIELVTASRDFLPSDVGKILGVPDNNIILSFPAVETFESGATIGVYIFADNSGFETSPGRLIFPFFNNGDFAELSTLVYVADEFTLLGLQQVYDNGINKTGLRYIMEKLVDVRPYKSITLAISQSGTDDPVIEHILENGLNETLTISRNNPGSYSLQISNPLFLYGKTFCFNQSGIAQNIPFIFNASRSSDQNIIFETVMNGTNTDSLLSPQFVFEIRIYK